jgi:hypothetical protein
VIWLARAACRLFCLISADAGHIACNKERAGNAAAAKKSPEKDAPSRGRGQKALCQQSLVRFRNSASTMIRQGLRNSLGAKMRWATTCC